MVSRLYDVKIFEVKCMKSHCRKFKLVGAGTYFSSGVRPSSSSNFLRFDSKFEIETHA